jgi:hypothetical protein
MQMGQAVNVWRLITDRREAIRHHVRCSTRRPVHTKFSERKLVILGQTFVWKYQGDQNYRAPSGTEVFIWYFAGLEVDRKVASFRETHLKRGSPTAKSR